MRREWEEAHRVTEEVVEGPPSKRANATLTACPNGNYLWCIGGEYFSEDGKAVCASSCNHMRSEYSEFQPTVHCSTSTTMCSVTPQKRSVFCCSRFSILTF